MPDESEETKKKKKCFIVTPIDEEGSPMRRHIEGIIDSAIFPVLENDYKIDVAHRIYTPGSIGKQAISSIYEADLVIANLTGLNPNVMYELAFRHALRKPVITIMEKGDKKLPFDVVTERTIFYINDSKGVLELKEELKKQVEALKIIDCNTLDNPIFSALESTIEEKNILGKIKESEPIDANAVKYILDRLDKIENKIENNNKYNNSRNFNKKLIRIIIKNNEKLSYDIRNSISNMISNMIMTIDNTNSTSIRNTDYGFEFMMNQYNNSDYMLESIIKNMLTEALFKIGIDNINFKINIIDIEKSSN
ncbi:hypothetical protein [Clostridium pasteurianum]|uniref:Nucleoside 2-deoxyribosyltransferase n=1 Tax=Clostridium pasteurianum BC1 TaxID=86416 RepID=R4KEB3_CLOPA|nr:hypothetical protein [Clostridium pasteurianum]AGK97960.1 hypothetical protein Clopa_3145 [Clostridium pasteurianum BC1]